MKRILIISPYFPPVNAADMQRVRMSLPYFSQFDWEAEVVTVDPTFADMPKDELFVHNLPSDLVVHKVNAFSKKWTSKFGLGSIALRSYWFFRKYVNQLLKAEHFDLIYFSTTQFPLLVLGNYWKRRFNIPYVVDMQDPWYSTYYEDKPKNERPAKYWFSHRLNKSLEPKAMASVDGLIAVSQGYIDTLVQRYPRLKNIPKKVITFGAFPADFDLVKRSSDSFELSYPKQTGTINLVYVGRGGHDMKLALSILFSAFKKGLTERKQDFERLRFHFIGTSYAPQGEGIPTIAPLAVDFGLDQYVNEQTDRISFYQSIYSLINADALLIIGSDDPNYTASKIYPYILAEKPLLAFFHPQSSAAEIIRQCNAGIVVPLGTAKEDTIAFTYASLLNIALGNSAAPTINWKAFESYTAAKMTKSQCELFDKIVNK